MNPPEPVWKRFYQSIKPLAYEIDSTHGTTPIYQQIGNLRDAKSAYGAIVYQKAPALLRVLAFDIGEDHFREGVRTFLREHAYANAEWSDLIGAFSRASGTDLRPWAEAWVEQRGMPKVEVDWACDAEQKISSFQIVRKMRWAKVICGPCGRRCCWAMPMGEPVRVMASLERARLRFRRQSGRLARHSFLATMRDHAYGLFLLDVKSQEAVSTPNCRESQDPFLRALLWGALWDGVRELTMIRRRHS